MKSNAIITVDLLPGTSIGNAIDEAKQLAYRLGIARVKFEFNGAKFSVSPNADVFDMVMAYNNGDKLICG